MEYPKPGTGWHGSFELKNETLARMRRHRADDDFIRGTYVRPDIWENGRVFRGCFHGCLTTEKLAEEANMTIAQFVKVVVPKHNWNWHQEAERLFGIPWRLGELLDDIFENQETYQGAANFAVTVTAAIPVGANLSKVYNEFYLAPESDDQADHADLIIRLIKETA